MVERSLSMREVPGSIPGFSTFIFHFIIFCVFKLSLTFISPAGMPLSQVLEVLQLHSSVVQTALLTYSDQKPFEQDISVDLNQDGVRLYFDPRSQRLKVSIH